MNQTKWLEIKRNTKWKNSEDCVKNKLDCVGIAKQKKKKEEEKKKKKTEY